MSDSNLSPAVPEFRDRSTGLLVFGILDILLGAGCLLMIVLLILSQMMSSRATGMEPGARMIAPVAMIYGGLAVTLVWLGIGSITRKRWARALLLILSWSWLMTGLVSLGVMLVMVPRLLRAGPAGGQQMPPGAFVAVMLFMLLFMGLLMVGVPGVMAFFYGSRHVKATCEARNPRPCWTDACPLPVLAVACWLWLGGASMLFMPVGYRVVVPFFGVLLTGLPAAILLGALAALWLWLGWRCYQLKPAAWWILVTVFAVFALSSTLTFARVDLMELYEKMGYPEAQIEMIRQQGWMTGRLLTVWMTIVLVPVLGYLVWVKRFFNRPQTTGGTSAQPAA
jgi:hypothetical protein